MWQWFKSKDRSDRLLIIFGGLFALMIAVQVFVSGRPSGALADTVVANATPSYSASIDRATPSYSAPSDAVPTTSTRSSVPPTAIVDGVTYNGQQQIDAMTQASRDAGLNEATAGRTGQEVAALCNGNPDCLR